MLLSYFFYRYPYMMIEFPIFDALFRYFDLEGVGLLSCLTTSTVKKLVFDFSI